MSAQQHGREMLRMLRSAPALSSGRVVDSVGMRRPQAVAALVALNRRGRCTKLAARSAALDDETSVAAAMSHPALAPPDRVLLASDATFEFGALVKGTPGWSARRDWATCTRRTMVVAARDRRGGGVECWQMLSECSVVPAALLWAVMDPPGMAAQIAAVGNRSCDPGMMRLATGAALSDVRVAVAHNLSCPADVLELLSTDSFDDVRWEVAKHASCTAATLEKMSHDSSATVRTLVARNERSVSETLQRLAGDPSGYVRLTVAANLSCPTETLKHLVSNDRRTDVRQTSNKMLELRSRRFAADTRRV